MDFCIFVSTIKVSSTDVIDSGYENIRKLCSLVMCFQICNSIEHYISLVIKTFMQFYNSFQIQ